jgi:hypothetical protein
VPHQTKPKVSEPKDGKNDKVVGKKEDCDDKMVIDTIQPNKIT